MSTYLELRTELSARGYSHLSTLRLGYLINRARARLDGMYLWPYREDSAQGAAPLSVPTLGIVEAVTNETRGYVLEEMGYADVLEFGDTSLTGSGYPAFWYRSTPAGAPVVNTYPSGTDTIGVQFWKVCVDLSGDSDTPQAPSRFHLLIVDIAQQQAERERGNFDASQSLQPDIDRQVSEMVDQLLPQQGPVHQKISWASQDW